MSPRAVSLLEVVDPVTWDTVRQVVDLDAHVVSWRSDRVCEVRDTLRAELPKLEARGLTPLVRRPRRPGPGGVVHLSDVALPAASRALLHRAQRHAVGGRVLDRHAFDPEHESDLVRPLLGAAWLFRDSVEPHWFVLHPQLPPPPPLAFDADEAILPRPDDLAPPKPGPLSLLHDTASLAAAVSAVSPKRTLAGSLGKADEKRLATHLGITGAVESTDRWGRAFRALEALQVVATDPITRELHLDLGLEVLLEGAVPDAIDALLMRLVEADLRPLLELVRTALRQAGDDALDEVVFCELVREQQRTVSFWPWLRDGERCYPGDPDRPFDDEGFERVEQRMILVLLSKLDRLGVVTRAPGVFAPTADGSAWAGREGAAAPPVWVTGDLEVVVPPGAVSPWERFQLERLGRCLGRDAVDRYRLERGALATWLETHELDEALGWLKRRAPALPAGVQDTLRSWARSATRLVWWDGILEEDPEVR